MGCGSSNGGSSPPQGQNQNQMHVEEDAGNQRREDERKEEERRKAEEAKRLEEEKQRKLEEEERQRKIEEEDRQRKLKEEEEKRKAQEEEEKRRKEEEEERKRKEEEQSQEAPKTNDAGSVVAASAGLDFGYIEAAIEEQNRYRAIHGMPPLTHSVTLSNYAQNWAEELSKGDNFAHSNCTLDDGTRVGENLAVGFTGTGIQMPAKNAVQMWYDEIKEYENFFGGEPDMKEFMKFGHFTQIVWKQTKEVGIGKVLKDGKTIIVGTYLPPGNLVGTFKDNVSPPV